MKNTYNAKNIKIIISNLDIYEEPSKRKPYRRDWDGNFYGMPSQGYKYTKNKHGYTVFEPDRRYFSQLRKAGLNMLYNDYSLEQATEELNKTYTTPVRGSQGGKKLKPSELKQVFLRAVYAGLIEDPNELNTYHPGNWQKMFTILEWCRLRSMLESEVKVTRGRQLYRCHNDATA